MDTIGFIGLGIMGAPMAASARSGYAVPPLQTAARQSVRTDREQRAITAIGEHP
jgi:3-hydroxyisobutyrate dehydrogenase-like beta-hydroxyacid dehydrogenase